MFDFFFFSFSKQTLLNVFPPDFKKLHEAHFNKMESIVTYVERKKRTIDAFKNPVKELKVTETGIDESIYIHSIQPDPSV